MNRVIDRQNERVILMAAFPAQQHRITIRKYLFNKFGDKFQPSIGQIVAATKDDGSIFYGRFEEGNNGDFVVEGVSVDEIRALRGHEVA